MYSFWSPSSTSTMVASKSRRYLKLFSFDFHSKKKNSKKVKIVLIYPSLYPFFLFLSYFSFTFSYIYIISLREIQNFIDPFSRLHARRKASRRIWRGSCQARRRWSQIWSPRLRGWVQKPCSRPRPIKLRDKIINFLIDSKFFCPVQIGKYGVKSEIGNLYGKYFSKKNYLCLNILFVYFLSLIINPRKLNWAIFNPLSRRTRPA